MVDGTENHERNLLVLENDHAAVPSKVEAVKEICRFDILRFIKNDGNLLTRFLSAVVKFLETYPNECSKAVINVLESAISDIVKLPLTSHLLNIICAVVDTGELEFIGSSNGEAAEKRSENKFSAGKDGLPDKLIRLMKCLNLCDKSVMWESLGDTSNFSKYISVILKCVNMRGSSDSVLTDLRQQTLRTVFRIFSSVKFVSVKPVSNETLNEWMEILLSLVFDNDSDIQISAVHALQLMWTCLASSGWTKDFICSPELKKQIKSDYCPKLIKLVDAAERVEPSWEVIWCLLVDILANQLLSNQNSQLTNSMLAVEERAFKRSDRAPAFKCWKHLIEKLCTSNGQDIKKHLKLLLQPLVISNTKNEQLIRLKHEVFWFFVCCAAPLCDDCSVVLNAFLRFNFGIPDQTDLSYFNLSASNSSVTGNGKHAFSGLKRNFHIFRSGCIDRLAQVLCPIPPESRDDFEFESPKLSVAVIKSPAQFLRLHPLIMYCACSAVLIVAYRRNKEAQEVLNVVWESLVYHIKSLITSEHPQKTKITEVTRDFLCFLRSMSRQCTDDSFSSLLLSPVFENVICGKNCFPPTFLSSRFSHMKMADDMLPTPAAVLVECLLTPAVVPQDDQSGRFQKMMEVLVECGFSSDCPLDLALGIMRRLDVCSYECDETKALTVYFTWYSLARKLETIIDKFLEVDPDLRNKLLEMVLGFPISRADYFRIAADKLTDEKQKPLGVWRSVLSSAVTHCSEEDKLNNKMCFYLSSKLMVYLKKDLNQQQCLYISKYIRVLGETVPWKDVTSHLVYSLDDIDCHTELLDEPCEQMSGIIDVLLSLYDHVIKYEDSSAEKCSESLRNLGVCLTTVCEAILNEVVFLSFVIKLKHVIAFLMLNFCNRGDEVLEHNFICCWMKITHSVERHWGHIKSESLTAAIITMLKAVAEHGSLEILRYTLKFWIGLPPKCNDLTPNLKHEIETMFAEMNNSLQRKEEMLKCNKSKPGHNKKRVSFAEKPAITTYSQVSVDSVHLNELSEKISSVKIQENLDAVIPDEGDDPSLLSQNNPKQVPPEDCVVIDETPTVADTVSQNSSRADMTISSDDSTGSVHAKNPFAKSFFSNKRRRGSSMATEVKTTIAVHDKNIEHPCAYEEANMDNKMELTDSSSSEHKQKNADIHSNALIPETNHKSMDDEVSSGCDIERKSEHENCSDNSEVESDNNSNTHVSRHIQPNKSRLSSRKTHDMLEDKNKLPDTTLKTVNKAESNTSVPRTDCGLFMKSESDTIVGKCLSSDDRSNKNHSVKNSITKEDSHSGNSTNIPITNTTEAQPLTLFGQVCDGNISPSAKAHSGKEAPTEMESQREDTNQNAKFAKPEEKRTIRRRKSLQTADCPVRQSPRRPLTKHQKECLKRKRDDIPALYCDLSEDSQSSTFSEMSQDDSQISIPERLSLSRPARLEEKQLSFANLRRVTKPNSLSSLIEKTLETPEEAKKNEINKGKLFSDTISPEAKVRKIDTTDTENKSPEGHENKYQVNDSLPHTLVSQDESVLTLKDSIINVVEKQLESDADGNNFTKSNGIKTTIIESNNSVKDDKENSSSIKTVSAHPDNGNPDVFSPVGTTMSENSPNRRKSLRPLKRIIRNVGKNSGTNKVGHVNKWKTQNRREPLHHLKRMIANKGKNSKSYKIQVLQGRLLQDGKNLSPSNNLGLLNSAVVETASVYEKNQLNCSTSEAAGVNSFKHNTPSPLKDLTQSKIDKYTLRSRLSSEENGPKANKSVQHEHQQMRRNSPAGPPSALIPKEVSVEINQREVQDAESALRKHKMADTAKSESNNQIEQFADTEKTVVSAKDGIGVQLQVDSTDKETTEKMILGTVSGQQDDTNSEMNKSKKLRGRPRKSLTIQPEISKDLCDVLSETANHNNVNSNDKSLKSDEHLQNTGGIKTRKIKERTVSETGKTVAKGDDQAGKARTREKHVTELIVIGDGSLSLSSKENTQKGNSLQSEKEPCKDSHALQTVTEIDASIISKDESDLSTQVEEITQTVSNETLQVEHEIKITRDKEKVDCVENKTPGSLPESVDAQQLKNLKPVSVPYVHLTNMAAKSNVANSSKEPSKCDMGSEERKSLQHSCLDTEDFVDDSQDLALSLNKRTRKWTRRISDGRNTRKNLDLKSHQLTASGSNQASSIDEEKGTATIDTLKTTSDSGFCKPVNEITASGISFETTIKQNHPRDSSESSSGCVGAKDKEMNVFNTTEAVDSNIKCSNFLSLQDLSCKEAVKPVIAKDPEQVLNSVDNTVVRNITRNKLHSSVNVNSVSTLTMRRSLRARRKPKMHGCLYSSCCRQVDTNKTRIAKRITAKSLRLARQGQLQRAESPADSGSLLPKVNSELHGESDLQPAMEKAECSVRTEFSLRNMRDSTSSKDLNGFEPEDINTKSESGCLKRKSVSDEEAQRDEVSPKKQKKRVSFSDPDISSTCYFQEYPIEETHKDYQWIASSGTMEDGYLENQLVLDLEDFGEYSDNMEEDTSLLDSQSPIWPSLAGCTYPVEEVVKFVVAPTWARNAVRYFEDQGIKTIGDISSLDEARISALPVREPKVAIVKKVLKVYEEKLNKIKAGATAAEVNSSRIRRKVQRPQRRGGLAPVIRKSSTKSDINQVKTSKESPLLTLAVCNASTSGDHHNSKKLEDKNCAVNMESLQNECSEVAEVVYESIGTSLFNSDRLQYCSEERESNIVQKIPSGSDHISLVENADNILISKLTNASMEQMQSVTKPKSSRQSANYTKDGTYLSGVGKSKDEVSSSSLAFDECTKSVPPSSRKDYNADIKDTDMSQIVPGEELEPLSTKQKHVQGKIVVVSSENITVRNLVKRDNGRKEEIQEKAVPSDPLMSAKEANENSAKWQEDVISQKEFDSILGDWNIAMSDDLLESGCIEILENGHCKEDGDVQSSNEFATSTNLPETSAAEVLVAHSACGNGSKIIADHHTVSNDEKPKDNVDCSIPELKTLIEKHSIENVTREVLRLWKYDEKLHQDIGNLLNKLENAETTDLKQKTQSVAVQANSCLCDLETVNTFKVIYEKICCAGESKT